MKKLTFLTIISLMGMIQLAAQDYEYVPFVREGVKWVYYHEYDDEFYPSIPGLQGGTVYAILEIKGDTTIDGKSYKAMHKYHGRAIDAANDTVVIYLREENKTVYGLVPDGVVYPDCDIDYGPRSSWGNYGPTISETLKAGQEFVLYDFNDPKNHYEGVMSYYKQSGLFEYVKTEPLSLGGVESKRSEFSLWGGKAYIIEGIGYDGVVPGYTLSYFHDILMPAPMFYLSHVLEDGEIIYKGQYYNPDTHVGIDEVAADRAVRPADGNYYNLMGQPMGKDVPTVLGIYIHQGKKIVVR